MDEPTGSGAARSLADAERIAALVRSRTSQNVIGWHAAIASAGAFYLTGIGAAGQAWVWIAMLSGLLGTVLFSVSALFFFSKDVSGAREQMRRWWRVALLWLLVLAATLAVGLPLFPGQLWYWLPLAVVSAVPLIFGIAFELRE